MIRVPTLLTKGPPGPKSRRAYLDDTLRTLWPEPTRITSAARPRRTERGTLDYIIVPNDRRPTLLLPRRPRRATAAALRNYKASATPSARFKLLLLSLAARSGVADLLPHQVRIEVGSSAAERGITGYLSQALGQDLLVSPYIGPPRAIQKPILQLLTPTGQTFGFAKIGVTPLTRGLVHGEAETLGFLATVPWAHLTVPRVLHSGRWLDHEVLVQQALSSTDRGRPDRTVLTAAMVELAGARGVSTHQLSASPYWSGLFVRLGALAPSGLVSSLVRTLTAFKGVASSTRLELGSWHGDWAPWNMTVSAGRVMVWDWEQFDTGVPVGYDALHHHVQHAVVRQGMTPSAAFESTRSQAAELLAPFGVRADVATLVVLLYAVEIAVRYLHDGEVDAGTRMGRLDSWLPEVLARHRDLLDSPSRP